MGFPIMINGVKATGEQVQKAINLIYDPCLFYMKANSNSYSRQVLSADTVKDVEFTNIDAMACGDFEYVGGIVTYVGSDDVLMSINMSCSIASSVVNTTVIIGQYKKGLIDYGVMNEGKLESSTAVVPFGLASTFTLTNGDTINLKIEADKDANVDIYFFQAVLKVIKFL